VGPLNSGVRIVKGMAGHTLEPRDAPNPDGDRRFAERPFPLLEPLQWDGERHRGGYGTRNPGSVTSSLGLVFGPWDPFVSEPRLAIDVGDSLPMNPHDEMAPFIMRSYFVADRQALLQPPDEAQAGERFITTILIEGAAIKLKALGRPTRWVGEGRWRGLHVFVHAIAIPPDRVQLRTATEIPPR
jgi:hypothetical protein